MLHFKVGGVALTRSLQKVKPIFCGIIGGIAFHTTIVQR
jgi:hypothetical protein